MAFLAGTLPSLIDRDYHALAKSFNLFVAKIAVAVFGRHMVGTWTMAIFATVAIQMLVLGQIDQA